MGRNDHNRDVMKRAILKAKIYHCVTISVLVIAAVVLSMLVWYLLSPSFGRVEHNESAETVTIEGATPAPEEEDTDTGKSSDSTSSGTKTSGSTSSKSELSSPTASDGTGQAGVKAVSDGRGTSSGISGWQNSDGKLWYEVSKNTCYYGGWKTIGTSTYYFDQDGYAAVGWKAISYQNGCYFDSSGVYDSTKDKSKMICLTFDTSPSEYTNDILDILSSNGAKATFFIQGSRAEMYGDVIQRISSLGNTIGNYSYSGAEIGYSSVETIAADFSKADEIIAKYNNGTGASVVRFPGGYYTREGAAASGKPNISWDVETYDLETEDANQIAANIYAQLQAGVIIHMHDVTQTDVDAVKQFVPELVAQGWEFVTIEDMAASRGYELTAGVTYLGFTQEDLEQGKVNDQ